MCRCASVYICVGNKIKRGDPGISGIEKRCPHTLEFPYSLVSQAWEGCYLPYPLIPGWAFLYPTLQGVVKGQPCLGTPPPATLLKPPGLWERGKREEIPNTDQSVQQNLKEQSRDSMVLEPYYRNAEEREKVERRKRERGEGGRRKGRRRQREKEEEREVRER